MEFVFICADISGTPILSHKLVIQPICDLLSKQGYTCKWGSWNPWGIPDDSQVIYVTGDGGVPPEKKPKTFFHPHGLHPVEKGLGIVEPYWKGYLSPGPWWGNDHHLPMPVCGWAKLDILFKLGLKEETISKYELKMPFERTVLYAPTGNWDWASSFQISIIPLINLFAGLPYNLLIKAGDYADSFQTWVEFRNHPLPNNIRYIDFREDITPLYLLSDLVITDGSSVAWEFICLDKPVIQLNNMPDPPTALCPSLWDCQNCYTISSKGGKYKTHPECKTCGGTIKSSLEDLRENVTKTMDNPNEFADERRRWAKQINAYVDGKCTERCVDAIKRIAGI